MAHPQDLERFELPNLTRQFGKIVAEELAKSQS